MKSGFIVLIALAVLVGLPGCRCGPVKVTACGPANCAGCCDSRGCQPGTAVEACGAHGLTCASCDTVCAEAACTSVAGTGGGSGESDAGAGVRWDPGAIDFGYVPPVTAVSRDVTFFNDGPISIQVSSFSTVGAGFSTSAPQTAVPPHGSATVPVGFTPPTLGHFTGFLRFSVDGAPTVAGVQLAGNGGGPTIQLTPPSADFGQIAWFAASASSHTLSFLVKNVGVAPAQPDPRANLHLGAVDVVPTNAPGNTATPGEFSVSFGPGYDATLGLEAVAGRDSTALVVKFTPASPGLKTVELRLHSDDPAQPTKSVTLTADAVVLSPCTFTVTPASLNFGAIAPGATRELSVTVTNLAQSAGQSCLVSGFSLSSGSSPIFVTSQPAAPSVLLAPGESLTIPVRAAPAAGLSPTGVDAVGTLQFDVSTPQQGRVEIPLKAKVMRGCLTFVPDRLDFGTVAANCNSATRSVSVYNVCPTAVVVSGSAMVAGATEFLPVNVAALGAGAQLAPGGAPTSFSLKYHPLDVGKDTGAFVVTVMEQGMSVDYLLTLAGTGDALGLNTETFSATDYGLDVLLVVDNSPSMESEIPTISSNFALFMTDLLAGNVNFQLGVTTTDLEVEAGRLVGTLQNPKILKPTTPDVVLKWSQKLAALGSMGSADEFIFEPALAALTPPLSVTENAGFLRPDARLAVVTVTDFDPTGGQPATYFLDQLRTVKGTGHAAEVSFNSIGPFTAACGGSIGQPAPMMQALVDATGGVSQELCAPDWHPMLQAVIANGLRASRDFPLVATPDLTGGKTVTVAIDGVVVPQTPTVWSWDPLGNAVHFEPLYAPAAGQTVTISYLVACLP